MAKKWNELTEKEKKDGIIGLVVLVVIAYFVIGNLFGTDKKTEENIVLEELTIDDIKYATLDKRQKIVAKYLNEQQLPAEQLDAFDTYFSHMAALTPGTKRALSVLTMAKAKYQKEGGIYGKYWKLTDLMSGKMSGWSGVFFPAEIYLKKQLNDPDSYEHVETSYRILTEGEHAPAMEIYMKFRAKNGFGAIVLGSATAQYDLQKEQLYGFSIDE